MSKVPHRPTGKGDTTKAERSARRVALLNVAAKRIGYESWSAVETAFREAVETASTDWRAQRAIVLLLENLLDEARERSESPECAGNPPADVIEALNAHPKRRRTWSAEDTPKREA